MSDHILQNMTRIYVLLNKRMESPIELLCGELFRKLMEDIFSLKDSNSKNLATHRNFCNRSHFFLRKRPSAKGANKVIDTSRTYYQKLLIVGALPPAFLFDTISVSAWISQRQHPDNEPRFIKQREVVCHRKKCQRNEQ